MRCHRCSRRDSKASRDVWNLKFEISERMAKAAFNAWGFVRRILRGTEQKECGGSGAGATRGIAGREGASQKPYGKAARADRKKGSSSAVEKETCAKDLTMLERSSILAL